ncbi:MAG: folate-binding protein YgfZ [Nitrosomonadales bacterium]|nr:folate-binding protein YgfZ [Nitrosomonadales bacterium]
MNTDWQNFLSSQNAKLLDGVVQDFGDAPAELVATRDSTVLCELGRFGTLRVTGEEAQAFLQNLLSSDIRAISPQQAQRSSLNTAKGRMLATFLIWQDGSDYLLQLPRTLCPAIQKKLSMFVLRSKVKISDASDDLVSLGLSGPQAGALLQGIFGTLPEGALAVRQQDGISLVRLADERFQLNTAAAQAPALWQKLSGAARPVGATCWDWLNIRAGIPVMNPATQEQFVPQMANLEIIGGVSFKKGCYPGQEIVARMQYLGHAKRRMYLAHVGGDIQPQPGDTLYSTSPEEQSNGMVVEASPSPASGFDLLGVIPISSREHHSVHVGSATGEALTFLPQPYELP